MEWFPQFRIFVKKEFEKLEERVSYIGIDEEATDVSSWKPLSGKLTSK